jgi:exodeoxyribonuclease VII large subunit
VPLQILQVSEVSAYIAGLLKNDPILSDVWIRGEIANLSRSTAGHYYFSVCDPSSQLRCVLFRGAASRQAVAPELGAEIVVHGRVTLYEARGSIDLVVDLLAPAGLGQARLEFEALRLRLEEEGLFALERKRALPPFPRRIGLVTSEGGAVLHDVLQVLGRRYPLLEVVLSPAAVQGERAAGEVCAALARLARLHQEGTALDLIVVARGGGSEQELAVFNDERVARACFGCPVPVVSAIGHETDTTLVDFVADLRAPTPSAAAELIAPDVATLRELLVDLAQRARLAARADLRQARHRLAVQRDRLRSLSPGASLARRQVEVEALSQRAICALEQRLALTREQLRGRALQLAALDPRRTLERGYAICTTADGAVLRSAAQVEPGEPLDLTLVDGVVETQVTGRRSPRVAPRAAASRTA